MDFKDTSGAVREKVWRLYEESFPAHERRSLTAQEQAFADCRARSKVMLDDEGEVMALVFYWLYAGMVYVEFLAVNPAMRGRNIGSGVVERLLELYPGKLVILEIEPPQEEMAVRRLHFYERLGFVRNPYNYIHPSYRKGTDAWSARIGAHEPRPHCDRERILRIYGVHAGSHLGICRLTDEDYGRKGGGPENEKQKSTG